MGLEPDTIVERLLRERLRIVAAATIIVRDVHAADDLFQQVVLSALEHAADLHDPDHLMAWSLRAVRQRAIDLARRRALRPLSNSVLDLLEADWGDPAEADSPDRIEALRRCVAKLAGPAREMLRMKYHDGMTAPTIANRLRRSPDAVYQSLSRLHRALRDCVEREMAQSAVGKIEEERP